MNNKCKKLEDKNEKEKEKLNLIIEEMRIKYHTLEIENEEEIKRLNENHLAIKRKEKTKRSQKKNEEKLKFETLISKMQELEHFNSELQEKLQEKFLE